MAAKVAQLQASPVKEELKTAHGAAAPNTAVVAAPVRGPAVFIDARPTERHTTAENIKAMFAQARTPDDKIRALGAYTHSMLPAVPSTVGPTLAVAPPPLAAAPPGTPPLAVAPPLAVVHAPLAMSTSPPALNPPCPSLHARDSDSGSLSSGASSCEVDDAMLRRMFPNEYMKLYRLKENQQRLNALPASMSEKLQSTKGRNDLLRELVEVGGDLSALQTNYSASVTDKLERGQLYDVITEQQVIIRYGAIKAQVIMDNKKAQGETEVDPHDPSGSVLYRLRKSNYQRNSNELAKQIEVSGSSSVSPRQFGDILDSMNQSSQLILPAAPTPGLLPAPKPKPTKAKKEEDTSPLGKVYCV